ncbi:MULTISPECIES: FxsB family cyclophane-forming radical SAM/SPASM peptide maturase [Protofrankia]|uniref:Fe-S oxidoreductase n=1 Tax=Protofrankia coriariae TaxID=1562887 RepID=A0ABR5F1W4_9ACTN|nr:MULTISPECIES: FxsB family cyclophane-forming radical SAM/SPASM peptide maturase [Protofrankia]KLL10702.1 Fe-S oxidoreductase [Protofrankia coriariae]ONH34437.1 radical SAM protein [Protofrankia sp. BMG5.30]
MAGHGHQDRPGERPGNILDVSALRNTDWRPVPFRQFVPKVHSRCSLACDYCYVYQMADQTWRSQPVTMPRSTAASAIDRIAEHASSHHLPLIHVILHGGEPLLAGREFISYLATTLCEALPVGTVVESGVQTNAVLLNEDLLQVFLEHQIGVGVSLDGTREAHDRHRRHPNGRGSHREVARALRLLGTEPYRELFTGLLCTIDIDTDPLVAYEELLEFNPPMIDFLLPHGNWTDPPPQRAGDSQSTPYSDWLVPLFDRWYSAASQETNIRLFGEILALVLGGASHSEAIGLTAATLLVIETDGAIEQVDTLKSTYPGAAATGLHITDHPFDAALAHPAIVARQIGLAALADTCQGCTVRDICGGGYYPHRYRAGAGFRNPSVYCPDLLALIRHIRTRVHGDLQRLQRQIH